MIYRHFRKRPLDGFAIDSIKRCPNYRRLIFNLSIKPVDSIEVKIDVSAFILNENYLLACARYVGQCTISIYKLLVVSEGADRNGCCLSYRIIFWTYHKDGTFYLQIARLTS